MNVLTSQNEQVIIELVLILTKCCHLNTNIIRPAIHTVTCQRNFVLNKYKCVRAQPL